ncbi:MAG: hypothetical protein ACM34K_13705, partial [Bacillota bacterium]
MVDFTNPHDTKSGSYLPNSPGLLSIGYVNENAVKLTWTDNSLGEAGFIIERSDSIDDNFFAVDTAEENATSFLSKFAVKAGVNYFFRIRAYKNKNMSACSNAVSAFLEFKAPTELRMTSQNISDNSVELRWKNNSTLTKNIIIQSRIPSEAVDFTTAAILSSDKGSFSVKNLDRDKIYEFRACAVSEHNTSAFTNTLSVFYGFISSEYQPYYSSYRSMTQEFSPIRNHFLATGDDYYNTSFKVYDADLHEEVYSLPVYTGFAKYSPTGKLIAIGRSYNKVSTDSLLLFVDAENGRVLKGLNYPVNTFYNNSIDFTPDGSKVIFCSPLNQDNYIAMLDVNTYQQLWKVTGLRIKIAKMSSDGKRVYAVQSDGLNEKILILNASDGSLINILDPEGNIINFMALSRDGNYIAVAPTDDSHNGRISRIMIINTNSLTVTNQINTPATSLEFTRDSKYLISSDSNIRVFRLSDGFQIGTLSLPNEGSYAVSCLSIN